MLLTSLISHPDLRVAGEVFSRPDQIGLPREAAVSYDLESYTKPGIPDAWTEMEFLPRIFEQHDGFLLHRSYIDPWRYTLSSLPEDTRVLFLSRRNLLLQFCSWRIMILQLQGRDEEAGKPLQLDLKEMKYKFQEWSYQDALYREKLADHHVHEIVYEDMCADYDREMEAVQHFLGLPAQKLRPSTEKVETRPLQEIIVNLEAVKRFLRSHQFPYNWDRFLE